MANTSPNNISYPTNASVKKPIEEHVQDTAESTQTALNTKANISGAAFTNSISATTIGLGGVTSPTQKLDSNGRIKLRSDGSISAGMWITDSSGTETAFLGASGTSSADAVGIYHNGAWRLQVDSSGRVMAPYQPAFYATRGSAGATTSASNVIVYNTAFVNVGNCYNTSNGRFTAPVAGNYCFTVTSIGNTSGTTRIYQRLNGANINGGMHLRSINTANYGDASITWMWPMSAGDYFDNLIGENSDYGGYYSSFSGFLVG